MVRHTNIYNWPKLVDAKWFQILKEVKIVREIELQQGTGGFVPTHVVPCAYVVYLQGVDGTSRAPCLSTAVVSHANVKTVFLPSCASHLQFIKHL